MPLNNVSASQVKTYRDCNRLWFYNRILKERSPQTAAQSKGTTVHGALEAYLKAGQIEPEILERANGLGITQKDLDGYIAAMLPFVGKPGEGLTEYKDSIPTYEGGPPFFLVVDHAREITVANYGVIPQIDDLKTTSDFRYCKTPDELGKETQMISYAKWALLRFYEEKNNPLPNFVSLRHVYVRTRGKRIATARDTLVTPEHVETYWAEILTDVRAMVALSDGENRDPANVAATTTDHCSAYGGCYFRSKCFGALYDGGRPFLALFNKTTTTVGEQKMPENNVVNGAAGGPRLSLAERMKLKNSGAAPAAPVAAAAAPQLTAVASPPAAPSLTAAQPSTTLAATPSTATLTTPQLLCGVQSAILHVACTLPPHSGDHESAAASGGVVHWTQDGKTFGLGKSENWKPALIMAPAVALPVAAVSDIPNILPPDAASRVSTPEEVAAAGAPKKRGRPKAVTPAAGATAAAPDSVQVAAAAVAAKTTDPVAATTLAAVLTQPVAVPGVCPLETLFIDCFPVKNSGAMPAMAEPLIAELSAAAAQAAGMPDWRLVEFGKGKGAMAVVLRERLGQMPKELVVSTSTPGADVVIEVLAPHAKRIVKALRG